MMKPRCIPGVKLETVRTSALPMGSRCRRSYRHSLTIPEQTNEYASRGTLIHEVIAKYMKTGKAEVDLAWPAIVPFAAWLQEKGIDPPHKYRHGPPWNGKPLELLPQNVEALLRRKLGGVWLSGHADVIYRARVIDWKTGAGFHLGPVEADWQMLGYAYLLHRRTKEEYIEVLRVMVDERAIDAHTHDFSDNLIEEALTELVAEMADPDAQFNPSAAGHCKFCFSRKTCPAYLEQARPIIGDALVDALIKVDGNPSLDQLAENLPAASTVVDLAKELLPKKQRAARRKYSPDVTLGQLGQALGGLTIEDSEACCSVSITAVERLLRDNLNYTKEDLFEFWRGVEQQGGKIA